MAKAELGTSEARRRLPELVKAASEDRAPSASPKDNAVTIRTRGQRGSASLVPTADLDAAEARIEALEDDLEDAGIALLVAERLATGGERVGAADFLRGIGMDEAVDALPRR